MTPEMFRAWRKSLGWKQKEAADRLGLKKRMIQYYEKGARDGRDVRIPKTVRLACYALSKGVEDFDGSEALLFAGARDKAEERTAKRAAKGTGRGQRGKSAGDGAAAPGDAKAVRKAGPTAVAEGKDKDKDKDKDKHTDEAHPAAQAKVADAKAHPVHADAGGASGTADEAPSS